MVDNQLFLETLQIASLSIPIDLSGSANQATVGDWISLAQGKKALVVFHKAIGTAGDDPTLTIRQASDAAGTGAKDLNFTTIYRKESTSAAGLKTVGQWTKTTQSAANTYTNDTSAESELLWCVEISAGSLDRDNGFCFINATVADVGGNAQVGALLVFVECSRNQSAVADVPSVLA